MIFTFPMVKCRSFLQGDPLKGQVLGLASRDSGVRVYQGVLSTIPKRLDISNGRLDHI